MKSARDAWTTEDEMRWLSTQPIEFLRKYKDLRNKWGNLSQIKCVAHSYTELLKRNERIG